MIADIKPNKLSHLILDKEKSQERKYPRRWTPQSHSASMIYFMLNINEKMS